MAVQVTICTFITHKSVAGNVLPSICPQYNNIIKKKHNERWKKLNDKKMYEQRESELNMRGCG